VHNALGLLGLRHKPNATQAQIRQAYLGRAKLWHPDRHIDTNDPQKERFALLMMQKINEAYHFLQLPPS